MSIPTCSSEKSQLIGTEFLEGSKLNFLASKQHQIALMKHLAAFESGILGSRPCCGWQDVPASQCLWCPIGLIHAEHAVLQRTSVTTTTKSATFTAQTLHDWHALMSAEQWQQESWKLREQWGTYRFKYETQCCLGHLGQGVASEKECLCSVCLGLLSCCLKQSHHCCSCWNIVAQGDVTRKLVYWEEAQFICSWYSIKGSSDENFRVTEF